ncbi:MAG: twin-arginine translocase subunit TatC [Halothiobacillaceae bacterium]|jgi:sec-independent protein translocase protein TatC|nr:twin-arginine translocase subunit TatC [Halothiobacillaceae bacterium]MDY0049641.1 twin-arginine translocase subunit TatC [Halothiobacillaceae bacterium]
MSQQTAAPEDDSGLKGFLAHLIELRNRLLYSVLAVIALMIGLLPFASELFHAFATPVLSSLPEGQSMIATGAISPFFIPLKLAALAAVFIAMPFLLYQLWAFIAPGLYQHERRLVLPLLVSSSALFYLGASFAYFIVIPAVFHFMGLFAPEGVSFMPDIGSYLDFSITLFFTFGLSFEVPVAVVLLVLVGVVTPDQLAEKRRYAVLVAFIIGAIFTPPDIFSQFMLAIPVWMLYEAGILVARMIHKNRRTDDEDEAEADGTVAPLAAATTAGVAAAAASEESRAEAAEEFDWDKEFDSAQADEKRLALSSPDAHMADETAAPESDAPTDAADGGERKPS